MGARSSEHGEEIEKVGKFLKGLCEESSGNQIPGVGRPWRKRDCINQGDYAPYGILPCTFTTKNPTMFSSSSSSSGSSCRMKILVLFALIAAKVGKPNQYALVYPYNLNFSINIISKF